MIRLRYPGQPWAAPFVYVTVKGRAVRVSPGRAVRLAPWRTDHRYRCHLCSWSWLDGPGSLASHQACPGCGSLYYSNQLQHET